MFPINIAAVQLRVGKGSSPVSLLWNNPACSYNLALKNEELRGSPKSQQMMDQRRGSVLTGQSSSCRKTQPGWGHARISRTEL